MCCTWALRSCTRRPFGGGGLMRGILLKTCRVCRVSKPANTEHFRPEPENRDRLAGRCRDCRNEARRALRHARCSACKLRRAASEAGLCSECSRPRCQVGACTSPAAHPDARWCELHAGPWGAEYADRRPGDPPTKVERPAGQSRALMPTTVMVSPEST